MDTVWWWGGFGAFIVAMLALDLGVFHRKSHHVGAREALIWTGVWIALAIAFAGLIAWTHGADDALAYLTGYAIEKSLSLDNIFVFLLIFRYFNVPDRQQYKVLFWGVIGALAFRAIFILAGVALINKFEGILYVFGGLLIVTAVRMAVKSDESIHPEKNPVLRLLRKVLPVSDDYHGDRFFVRRKNGSAWAATPLFVALVFVETTDIVFAMDSIPAILGITRDVFLVYSSNVLAILGLRALYFALSGVMDRFRYLKFGLAAVLLFVGVKLCLESIVEIPVWVSLAVILAAVGASVIASLVATRSGNK